MLLHIHPNIFVRDRRRCELAELEVQPFGLTLRGGVDLATRRPYPNKCLYVACRKNGNAGKAINGLLLETRDHVSEFRTVARWIVAAAPVLTHKVNYSIIDKDFAAASDNASLWYASHGEPWESRWPEGFREF